MGICSPFGNQGEIPVAPNRLGRDSKAFDARLQGHYPRNLPLRIIRLAKSNATDDAAFPATAQLFEFDRPVILWPMANTAAAAGGTSSVSAPTIQNWVYAIPVTKNDPGDGRYTHGVGTGYRPVITSTNSGVLYLQNGGRWYIYYPENVAKEFLVIDASDPVTAWWYLSRPGNHTFSVHKTDETHLFPTGFYSATGWPFYAIPGNRDRKAVWIQNLGTTNMRISFGSAAVPSHSLIEEDMSTTVVTARGIRVVPDAIFHAAGDDLFLDDIYVVPEDGGIWTYSAVDDDYTVTTPGDDLVFTAWETI